MGPREGADTTSENLEQIQRALLERLQNGERVDRESVLADHPEHSEALATFLDVLQEIHPMPGSPSDDPVDMGEFRILRELGRGGMGVVYEAEQPSLKRRVALKILLPGQSSDPRLVARFRREAEAAGRLRHRGIVPVFSIGEAAGVPFFAMELVEGRSLAAVIHERAEGGDAGLPAAGEPWRRWCAETIARVADALHHAHEKQILHRDVKPANILLEADGSPRLTDFGLAADMEATGLTRTGETIGTPLYMSPEQAIRRETPLGPTTDVYSLGVTLYEALTLRTPYEGTSSAEIFVALRNGEILPPRETDPGMPPALEAILLRALRRDPAERYGSAAEFASALRKFARGEARPRVEAAAPSRSRRVGARLTAAVLGLLLLGAAVAFILSRGTGTAERRVMAVADAALADLKAGFDAGIPMSDRTPDVASYLTAWGHYRYLADGMDGRLPEEYDAAREDPHLRYLLESIRTRKLEDGATKEDIRAALRRFGAADGMEGLSDRDRDGLIERRKELEDSFAAGLDSWLRKVETFVAERRGRGETLRRDFDAAIEAFEEACRRERVRPHQSLDRLLSIAATIRAAASGLDSDSAGQTPIGSIAESEADLVAMLRTLKEVTSEESGLRGRAASLLAPFEAKEITSTLPSRYQALLRLDREIEAAMKPGGAGQTWPERPTEDDLLTRRRVITEEIEKLGTECWSRIEPHLAALEPGQIYEEVGEGEEKKKVRKPGWYDTIPLLAQARRADQRKDEYLQNGLIPWLESEKWRLLRPTDTDSEIYSTKQFVEVMLPRLRAQSEFFEVADEDGLVAREIAREAQRRIHAAVRSWLEGADGHWTKQFQTALPSPARTLAQVRSQLDEMKGVRPSLLMTTGRNVQKALGYVNRISEDPRGDPVLADSEAARDSLFRKWAVCFELEDLSVYTIHRAVGDLGDFSNAIGMVVGPLGTDAEQARGLVAAALKGGGSFLTLASAIPERVLAGAEEGSPSAEFAVRLDAIVRETWAGLVEKAAEDVNERWATVRAALSSATTPSAFQAAFGPAGPLGAFRKHYLEDLFDGPELLPKQQILGRRIILTEGLRASLKHADTLASGIFDPTGTTRSDRVILDLQLGGTGADGLVVEFHPRTGPNLTSPRYINGPRVTFALQWSPLDCREFGFTVYFPNGEPRKHRWTGDWAVAEAFRDARREGERYVWPKTPGAWKNDAGQDYEVWLALLPGSTRRLIDIHSGGNVTDPVKALVDSLPETAVAVEE